MEKSSNTLRNLLLGAFSLLLIMVIILGYFLFQSLQNTISSRSNIEVLESDVVLTVPDVVTKGVPFEYRATGTKLTDASARVNRQVNCKMPDGTTVVEPIDSFASKQPAGEFDVKQSFVVPTFKLNLRNSDDCRLILSIDYDFYTGGSSREPRYVPVNQIITSNRFKLWIDPAIQEQGSNRVIQ